MEINDLMKSGVILSRRANTDSSRRRQLAKVLSGELLRDDEVVSVIQIGEREYKALSEIGYSKLFRIGGNYTTRGEVAVIITELKAKIPTIKSKAKQKKVINLVNYLMQCFGPSFAKRMGGFL